MTTKSISARPEAPATNGPTSADWNRLVASLEPADREPLYEAVRVVHGISTDVIDGRDPQRGLEGLREIVESMSQLAVDTFASWWLYQTARRPWGEGVSE